MRFAKRPVFLVLICWLFAGLHAQSPELPVIRITSELVLVDVVVTDSEDRFVDSLTASDFQILEDGKKQNLAYFLRIGGAHGVAAEIAPQLPTAVSAAAAPAETAKIVILVDSPTVDSSTLMRVREALTSFFQALSPGDEIMLAHVDNGLRIFQPLTTDRGAVLEAIGDIPLSRSATLDEVTVAELLARLEDNYRNVPRDRESVLGMALEQSVANANDFLNVLESRLLNTTRAVNLLADSMKRFRGRKSIIYLSGGFPMKPLPMLRQSLTDLTMAY